MFFYQLILQFIHQPIVLTLSNLYKNQELISIILPPAVPNFILEVVANESTGAQTLLDGGTNSRRMLTLQVHKTIDFSGNRRLYHCPCRKRANDSQLSSMLKWGMPSHCPVRKTSSCSSCPITDDEEASARLPFGAQRLWTPLLVVQPPKRRDGLYRRRALDASSHGAPWGVRRTSWKLLGSIRKTSSPV